MTSKVTGSRMDFSASAHLSADTEIEVRHQSTGGWYLQVGSLVWDSPSSGQIVLFARSSADLLRVRDAISAAVEGTSGE